MVKMRAGGVSSKAYQRFLAPVVFEEDCRIVGNPRSLTAH